MADLTHLVPSERAAWCCGRSMAGEVVNMKWTLWNVKWALWVGGALLWVALVPLGQVENALGKALL